MDGLIDEHGSIYMKNVVLALTKGGEKLAEQIVSGLADCSPQQIDESVASTLDKIWPAYDGIICIMAAGIVVRSIAPLCRDKKKDPCVIVLDEKGEFVVSLLSGHLGGGNRLAKRIAAITGGQPVITTSSDVVGCTAIDLWAKGNQLVVDDHRKLTTVAAKLVNQGFVTIYSDILVNSFPADFKEVSNVRRCDIIFSHKRYTGNPALQLCPKNLVVGLGCNRDTGCNAFDIAVVELFEKENIDRNSIAAFASIDIKNDEKGLIEFAKDNNCPLLFYSKDELNEVSGVSTSLAALSATGAKGVAEPAAILGANSEAGPGKLIVRKHTWKDVTAAIAEKTVQLKEFAS